MRAHPHGTRAVATLALAGLLTLSLPVGVAAGADACVDSAGRYRMPDGLVLGGAKDNSRQAPFAAWLQACGFTAKESTRDVATPYADAVRTWAGCMESAARTVEVSLREYRAARPSSMPAPPADIAQLPARSCGPAPDPTATDAQGRLHRQVTYLTLGGARGQMSFSVTSFIHTGMHHETGRASTVFWGGGADAAQAALAKGHFQPDTARRPEGCGDPRHFRVGTSPDTASWAVNRYDLEAHAGGKVCMEDRYHMRLYPGAGQAGAFGPWAVANIHQDLDWHTHSPGGPGVAHLDAEQAGFAKSTALAWSPTLQFYVRVYRI